MTQDMYRARILRLVRSFMCALGFLVVAFVIISDLKLEGRDTFDIVWIGLMALFASGAFVISTANWFSFVDGLNDLIDELEGKKKETKPGRQDTPTTNTM